MIYTAEILFSDCMIIVFLFFSPGHYWWAGGIEDYIAGGFQVYKWLDETPAPSTDCKIDFDIYYNPR